MFTGLFVRVDYSCSCLSEYVITAADELVLTTLFQQFL